LFDEKNLENPLKASTYIYNAFKGKYSQIDESLKNNISYGNLVEMLTFDRSSFDKSISLNVEKKVEFDTQWEKIKFGEIADIVRGVTYSKSDQKLEKTENIVLTADNITLDGNLEIKKEIFLYENFNVSEEKRLKKNDIFMCFSSGSKEHLGKVAFIENDTNYLAGGFMGIIRAKENVMPKYLFQLLNSVLRQQIRDLGTGSNINNLSGIINEVKIPLPPKEIQEKIVAEIEVLEKKEEKAKEKIEEFKEQITNIHADVNAELKKLVDLCEYSTTRINCELLTSKNYVGVDNILQNTEGKIESDFVPDKGTATEYLERDILLSNIRPYLKKIWYADNCGGSSNDVLVLRTKTEYNSKYIYYYLKQDAFFDYEMQATKGVKMPRGDKQHILQYQIPVPPLSDQQKIVAEIEKLEAQINELEQQLAEIPKKKEQILKKYL
jgi:type I restriction enzyme M protein